MFVLMELEEGPSMWVPLALVTAFKCPKRTVFLLGLGGAGLILAYKGNPGQLLRSYSRVLQSHRSVPLNIKNKFYCLFLRLFCCKLNFIQSLKLIQKLNFI